MTKIQTIFRGAGAGRHFVSVLREFAQRGDASHELKGLVLELISHEPTYEVSFAGILACNDKLGPKKLRRILREGEELGVIVGFQPRDKAGTFKRQFYFVSDDKAELEEAIQRVAEDLLKRMDEAASEEIPPCAQNGQAAVHEPLARLRQAAKRQAAKDTQQKNKETKEKSNKEEAGRFSKNENSPRPRQPQLLDLPKTASSRNGVADAEVHEGWAVLKAAFRTLGAGCNRNDQRDRLMRDIIRSEGLDALREIGEAIKTQLFLRGAGKQGWKLKPNQVLESAELRARIRDGNYVDVWMPAGANAQMRGRPGR